MNPTDYADFVIRLAMDIASISAVTAFLYLRRHRRRDLFLVFTTFNVGVFAVLAVITEHKISAAVGFGLFALLSIIRLRSEPFANLELTYFFAALVLGVINGIGHSDHRFAAVLDALVVVAVFTLDHPRVQRSVYTRRVILDEVVEDNATLMHELEHRFGIQILAGRIAEIDYVRETTTASIRYVDRSAPDPIVEIADDEQVAT